MHPAFCKQKRMTGIVRCLRNAGNRAGAADGIGRAVCAAQRAEVGHSAGVVPGERMSNIAVGVRFAGDGSYSIHGVSRAVRAAERTEINRLSAGLTDERTADPGVEAVGPACFGKADDLSGVADAPRFAVRVARQGADFMGYAVPNKRPRMAQNIERCPRRLSGIIDGVGKTCMVLRQSADRRQSVLAADVPLRVLRECGLPTIV